ncbi:MAG: hypothetical protein JST36_06890 [Bacteroidetes bacterium]|nr:hypothetical protein [Bacteroidota bacterium]
MKKKALLSLFLFSSIAAMAQNVGVGTKIPKYVLTVKDTNNTSLGQGFAQISPDGTIAVGTFVDNTYGAYIQTHTNNNLNFSTNNMAAQMTLQKGNGFLGIGTETPAQKLDIKKGRLRFSGNVSSGIAPGIEFTKADETTVNGFLGTFNDTTMGFYGFTGAGWKMLFNTNTGNLGLQGNTNPLAPLSFANTVGPKIEFYNSGVNNRYGIGLQGYLMQFYAGSASDNIAFGYGSSSSFTELMRIKGNGNVGIATANPSEKLEVAGNMKLTDTLKVRRVAVLGTVANYPLTVQADGEGVGQISSNGANAVGFSVNSTNAYVQTHTATDLNFTTNNGGAKVTLQNSTGNLGIGTQNPSTKLEVNGTTKTTNLIMTTGAGADKLLTSDASGNASWKESPTKADAAMTFMIPNSSHPLGWQSVSSGTAVTVPFQDNVSGTAGFDNGNNFNNTTKAYTVPSNGFYHVFTSLNLNNLIAASGGAIQVQILVTRGSATTSYTVHQSYLDNGDYLPANVNGVYDMPLQAGDVVKIQFYQSSGVTQYMIPGEGTGFALYKIF